MIISEDVLYKCGFRKTSIELDKTFLRMRKSIEVLKIQSNQAYILKKERYSFELEGCVDVIYYCYKCVFRNGKHGWVLHTIQEEEFFEHIKTSQELENSCDVLYNNSMGFCYIIQSEYGHKIGQTKSLYSRSKTFNVKLPFKWVFVKLFVLTDYKRMEIMAHQLLEDKRLNGEWFDLNSKDIELIESLYQTLRSCPT